MHLLQAKRASIESGGAQYFLHGLTKQRRQYLRSARSVPVALVTPYGATPSSFVALAHDVKLTPSGEVVPGRVGKDRIQQGGAGESIGEAIRYWYKLKSGDFEWIEVDIEDLDDKFYLTPFSYK